MGGTPLQRTCMELLSLSLCSLKDRILLAESSIPPSIPLQEVLVRPIHRRRQMAATIAGR